MCIFVVLKIFDTNTFYMPIHLISIVDNISGKCKSTKSVLALMMEFGANVGTRVPIGDVDMVYFFVKIIN